MKKIIAVLISLGLLASFSGCGNSESQTELTCFVHADIFSYMFLKISLYFLILNKARYRFLRSIPR